MYQISNSDFNIVVLNEVDEYFYDNNNIYADPYEQFGYISVNAVKTAGLDTSGIQNVQKGLNRGSSVINTWAVDGVSEDIIVKNIEKLQTYSDIIDLSNSINAGGSWVNLEDFINDQLFDDPEEMRMVAMHLGSLAVKSGKQRDTVRLTGGKLSIGLGQ